MQGAGSVRDVPKYDKHHPAADTPAVVTLAAGGADIRWVIDSIHYSFDAAPAAEKKLNITVAGTEQWAVEGITGAGVGEINFPCGFWGGLNEAVVVTLEADTAGAVGKVNITYR